MESDLPNIVDQSINFIFGTVLIVTLYVSLGHYLGGAFYSMSCVKEAVPTIGFWLFFY